MTAPGELPASRDASVWDTDGFGKLRKAAAKLGATVLVVAPAGGVLSYGARQETVDRTLVTTRLVEFDAVVIAAARPRPAISS